MFLQLSNNIRYAHIRGYTNCIYSEDGKSMITCGADGDVRIWNGINGDDLTSTCLGEFILGISHYDNKLLVSTDINVVYVYKFPEFTREEILFRFTTPANCIKVNKNFIAAGSEDTKIKVLARNKNEPNEFELKNHAGPILYLDISKKDLLASCTGDGTIRIWNLNKKRTIKTITGLPKVTSFKNVKYFGTPCFEPQNGDYLIYCNEREIIALNCDNWEIKMKLENCSNLHSYTYCAFSHCGYYVAAGTTSGKIIVWDITNNQIIPQTNTSSLNELENITSIEWNPKDNVKEFSYCDSCGHLGIMNLNGCQVSINKGIALIENRRNSVEDDLNDIEYEDDDNDECVALERLKNKIYKEFNININDEITKEIQNCHTSVQSEEKNYQIKTYVQQPSFQPGATPQELEHRYLTWNNVGIVRAHKDDYCGSIDVEFHDASLHHALHMNNYMNHSMASLSSNVVALSGYNSNKLVCIALGASGSREWSVEMPNCEGIMVIAATSQLVAVATDASFLRIFSALGTQREVISIPGPVVALCGYEDKLMITYHSAPASENQHISAMLLQTFGLTLRCREVRVPITPGKKLTWIGYTDQGSPICYDTMGLIKMYNLKTNCWYPICETINHIGSVSNNFYIVEVSESNQKIEGIICRGCAYPMTSPRPIVTEIPMKMPLCEIDSDKSQLEESLIRLSNFSINDSEKIMKETAIRLFALACRTEMEARAEELIEMIGSPYILSLAVKYASKLGRIHLSDKLSELLPQMEEKEKQKENEMKETNSDVMNLLQNISFKETLILIQQSKSRISTPQSSPVIAPKPMSLSRIKRNPFKKTSTSNLTPNSKNNPLSHLTEKIMQAEVKNGQTEIIEENVTQNTNNKNGEVPAKFENQTKKSNEKPMSLSWIKRNPFKKTSTSNLTPNSKYNPLSHLTEKIMQAEVKNGQTEIIEENITQTTNKENDEVPATFENQTKTSNEKTTSGKTNLVQWLHKNQVLKEKHPDKSSSELKKKGLKEFKQQLNDEKEGNNCNKSMKRKLDESFEKNEKVSGIAKLSKFEFKN